MSNLRRIASLWVDCIVKSTQSHSRGKHDPKPSDFKFHALSTVQDLHCLRVESPSLGNRPQGRKPETKKPTDRSVLQPTSLLHTNILLCMSRHQGEGSKDKQTSPLPAKNLDATGETEQPSKKGVAGSEGTDDKEGFMEKMAFQLDPEELRDSKDD